MMALMDEIDDMQNYEDGGDSFDERCEDPSEDEDDDGADEDDDDNDDDSNDDADADEKDTAENETSRSTKRAASSIISRDPKARRM